MMASNIEETIRQIVRDEFDGLLDVFIALLNGYQSVNHDHRESVALECEPRLAANTVRFIRLAIFKVSQEEFAAIAKVAQPSVSRWENGGSPSLEEMQNIRKEAVARKLPWDDRWFFEVPETAP